MQRYEIYEEVGRGGSGVVYRAHDRERGHTVALKQLRRETIDPVLRARFLREAQVAGKLHHPAIASIYTFGFDEHRPYFTMPFIRGESLSHRLKSGPFSEGEIRRILAPIAGALVYIHEQGVVHRDVKPANIVIDSDGAAVLVDFGIARELGTSRLTETGEVLGTPHYMSPEQMIPGRESGPASDVYSLGCVLYEMLCGQTPFEGDSFLELSSRLLNDEVIPPSIHRAGVAPALEKLCLQCLDRDEAVRPSASDVRGALEKVGPVPAVVGRTPFWMLILPGLAVLAALALSGARRLDSIPPGRIMIDTDPSGAVVEGEGWRGTTPFEYRSSSSAESLVHLRKEGYADAAIVVVGCPGKIIRHRIRLRAPEEIPSGMIFDPASSLYVDRTEVSREAYSEFLVHSNREQPLDWRVGCPPRGTEHHAVTGVTASDAAAYARWAGKRLPTESEWVAIFTSGAGRRFPWGGDLPFRGGELIDGHEFQRGPAPVASSGYDATPAGVLDLAGGVREWTSTPGAFDFSLRVVKGGAWSDPFRLRSHSRIDEVPATLRDRTIGFRCVQDVE